MLNHPRVVSMIEQHGGNDPEYRAGVAAYLQHVKDKGQEPDLGKRSDNFQRGWLAMHDMRQYMLEKGEYRDAAASGNAHAVPEPAKPLQASETLDRLTSLRLEYADNPDKHILAEARGIADAVAGPDVTRVPFTVSAVEYVKGNLSRADLEQLAAKNERAAAHDKSPRHDQDKGNDLGR